MNKPIYKNDPTEGLTSQDAVAAVGNRYDLVLIAARRVRELAYGGYRPMVANGQHGPVLTALKEIEQGKVDRSYLLKPTQLAQRKR